MTLRRATLLLAVAAGALTLGAGSATSPRVVVTGIKDIQSFLEKCPTNDSAFATLRQDFELRVDGGPPTAVPACAEPMSALPIDKLTDELIVWQILRTAFYMSQGTEGKLPWTTKSLYDWMKSHISGVNIKTAPGRLYCCEVIDGRLYFSTSRGDATQRDPKRAWPGISNSLNFYVHEIRHADLGSLGHTTGCELFPLPTGPVGCDATYDVNNLGGYGVQFWLESSWALGLLNIGIGCAPSDIAHAYAKWDERSANNFRSRFVTNIPPAVVAPTPFGGPCLR